ncbi:hypothetical protein M3Y99_01030500 [Aphelenchoides fujianensis]|nr:hypothetical protein M3Y99_01030500 [Aphelenchoides fujianensis]
MNNRLLLVFSLLAAVLVLISAAPSHSHSHSHEHRKFLSLYTSLMKFL